MARLARRAAPHARARRRAARLRRCGGRRRARYRRPARDGRFQPRAGGAAADVRRLRAARPRHDASDGDSRAGGADRRRADVVRLRLEVGLDARDALAHRLLLEEDRWQGRAVRRRHRSRLPAGVARERARLPRRVPRRADDRRPLLGPLAVRDRPRRARRHRRRRAARERRAHGRALPPRRREPGLRARERIRLGLERRARQDLHRRDRGGFRAVGRAADRGVDRQARQGARAGAGRVARRPRPAVGGAGPRRSGVARR